MLNIFYNFQLIGWIFLNLITVRQVLVKHIMRMEESIWIIIKLLLNLHIYIHIGKSYNFKNISTTLNLSMYMEADIVTALSVNNKII